MSLCPLVNSAVASGQLSFDVAGMLGPLYIGIPASALVYGITCCQVVYYYRSEKATQDHWAIKALVAGSMVLTFLQEAFIIALGYDYFITNYDNPCQFLSKLYWGLPAEMAINGFLELAVEGFLIFRTYRLSHNIYMAAICSIFILAGFSLTLAVPIELLVSKENAAANLLGSRVLTSVSKGIVVFGDACNTATMIFYLYRSKTGFRRSETLIMRLVTLTISTGGLTAIISLGDFLGVLLSNGTTAIVCFDFIVGKLYVNVLLTILGLRGSFLSLSAQSSTKGFNSIHLSRIPGVVQNSKGASKQNIVIDVENTVENDTSETKARGIPGSFSAPGSRTLVNASSKSTL